MKWADETADVRVVIISGNGANFSAGIDLGMMMALGKQIEDACEARMRENLRDVILDLQDCLTAIERCRKPVIAAVHGACIGGAVDLISCCDMRYASNNATFSIKEIDNFVDTTQKQVDDMFKENPEIKGKLLEHLNKGTQELKEKLKNFHFEYEEGLEELKQQIAQQITRFENKQQLQNSKKLKI